ncbi:MAG: GGDEF domain-containing protein, partial [Lachnospiraceae bacterium]
IYIIVLGVRSIENTRKLLSYGISAKKYRQLAYHDQLTGLYNRTAYTADKNKEDFSPQNYVVMMFDLNDLKHCNDTYGHEKGDNYIRKSAEFIERYFSDIGRCYRIGGDEFCVLIKDGSLELCKERLQKMRLEIQEYNQKYVEEYPIRIACGYVRYDEENDHNLEETLRRADKMMYQEKFTMKQEKTG